MTTVFKPGYSAFYDLVYEDKDYGTECSMVEALFERFGTERPKSLIDLGCGTGGHAIPFAERGFDVTGVDRSASMLRFAKNKAEAKNLGISFHQADIREFAIPERFDAAVCMFAVLCYQLSNEDLSRALFSISSHLKPGSLFVFDFWYGPAVLAIKPEIRVRVIEKDDEKLLRLVKPTLDTRLQQTETEYRLVHLKGNSLLKEVCESHRVRYFFPLEIEYFLETSGFEMLHMGAFPDFEQPPNDQTWNVLAVARKLYNP